MWKSTEKEVGTQVSMEKIEQWEVLEIQTKVYGKSTNPVERAGTLLIGSRKIFTSEAE